MLVGLDEVAGGGGLGEIAARFLSAVPARPRVRRLLSTEPVRVDRTLIEAWASMKSIRPKGGGDGPDASSGGRYAPADFGGERRSNATHASTTEPDARLYRKGPGMEAKLAYRGHALMENRSGLFVDARVTRADGHAERVAALTMIEPFADRPRPVTLGADRGYDAEDFVNELRSMNVRPHVAQTLCRDRGATVFFELGLTKARSIHAFAPPSPWDGERRRLRGEDLEARGFRRSGTFMPRVASRPGPSR